MAHRFMSLNDNDLARNERSRTARQISPRRHRAEFLSLYHTAGFSGSITAVSIESFNAEERGGAEGAEDDAVLTTEDTEDTEDNAVVIGVIPREAPPLSSRAKRRDLMPFTVAGSSTRPRSRRSPGSRGMTTPLPVEIPREACSSARDHRAVASHLPFDPLAD
ncbi:MAG TPA: hypothetical protein VF159_08880 [Gemmatimonadaceae bacterium]